MVEAIGSDELIGQAAGLRLGFRPSPRMQRKAAPVVADRYSSP